MCGIDSDLATASTLERSAKRETKRLKKLRSVSKAYRKSKVKALKREADDLRLTAEQRKREAELSCRQYEMLRNAHPTYSQSQLAPAVGSFWTGIFGRT